jgi:hypothetical protein
MSNVKIEMVNDANGDLTDVRYWHRFCAPNRDEVQDYPAPESMDYLVYCDQCGEWIDAIPLTDDGAAQLLEDDFFKAYCDCALWASYDYDADGNVDECLDAQFSASDIDAQSLAKMYADCADFRKANRDDLSGIDADSAGHDFWLTRNHHGAGFWDRDLGEIGKRLTDAAHVYGESDLYVYTAPDGEKRIAVS